MILQILLILPFYRLSRSSILGSLEWKEINVVCCVGRVEIQIEIQKGRCTANTDSIDSIVYTIRIGSTPTFLYLEWKESFKINARFYSKNYILIYLRKMNCACSKKCHHSFLLCITHPLKFLDIYFSFFQFLV